MQYSTGNGNVTATHLTMIMVREWQLYVQTSSGGVLHVQTTESPLDIVMSELITSCRLSAYT